MANMSLQKHPMPEQDPQVRAGNFKEVALGYTADIAVEEAQRCLHCKNAPCVSGCPVNVPIPDFIDKIKEGDFNGAYQVIRSQNALPAICGRVCPQESQCESKCVRGIKGEPVGIGRLERFAADTAMAQGKASAAKAAPCGKRAAVIGSGPAGLTCAGELAKAGWDVTVYEALHTAGGVLMYGIPEFRLPKALVEREISSLKELGVKIITNAVAGKAFTVDELLEEGNDAVFIGSGAGLPNFQKIPGESLCGVYSANEFLTRLNLMKAYTFPEHDTPVKIGKHVAVVGGGNVAMDAARCAKRLGAEVTILYRRSEAEMPARAEEVHHAKEEGIQFHMLTAPTSIEGDENGFVKAIRCIEMKLGEPDERGRRRPVPVEGSEYELPMETVIIAIGNSPNPLIKKTTPDLPTERWGGIQTDENGRTGKKNVYAGGDAVTGAATVILAMGAGKRQPLPSWRIIPAEKTGRKTFMFGFDERYAMFDITPVENQFILDYLPDARGDYVKVYLYGLMRCYHPEEDMSLARMCHELNMTEEDVAAAFRYWERRRLVRRISDNPPQWKYINIKQKNLVSDDDCDPEYEDFSNAVYEAFDKVRRLHGSELSACFEWHEGLKLPTEVIIMLLNHMVDIKGKNFRISDAEKTAVQMASEKIMSVDAAEEFFSRDEQAYTGIRKILKKMGKRYLPSEAQVSLYRKWTREWGFSHDAVEAALELTAKGDPSLGYLDGILNSLRQENPDAGEMTPDTIRHSAQRADGLREVLKEIGKGEVNPRNLQMYDRMTELYPQEVILTAARECGHSGKDTGEVLKLLQAWKEKGLETPKDVKDYVQAFHDQTALIRELRKIWGTDENRVGKTDRSMIAKWENEMGFSREMILAAAPYAAEAKTPMAYLDKILTDYQEKGIRTPEQARKDHEKRKTTGPKKNEKVLPAQDFAQRDYSGVQEEMMQTLAREMEAFKHGNGGKSDA